MNLWLFSCPQEYRGMSWEVAALSLVSHSVSGELTVGILTGANKSLFWITTNKDTTRLHYKGSPSKRSFIYSLLKKKKFIECLLHIFRHRRYNNK